MNPQPVTLPPDYHTHNSLCKHAEGQPKDYVRAALAGQLPGLACTDHCPTDVEFGIEHRMALEQFPVYVEWVKEAQSIHGAEVLFGLEADYYEGSERFLGKILERFPIDIVLGSVHFRDYWSRDPSRRGLTNGEPRTLWREYFTLIGHMADTGCYDVVAHFDLPKKFGNEIPAGELREYALPALDRIAAAGMCLEINTSGYRHTGVEPYPSLEILRWAHARGIGLTFGSDAHLPSRVGADFDRAVALAREAGYTHHQRFRARAKTAVALG